MTQPCATELAPCSAHDDAKHRRTGQKSSKHRSGPDCWWIGNTRSCLCQGKTKQAGNSRDNRWQIEMFGFKREHAHARKQDHAAKASTSKARDNSPSRGHQLRGCSENAEGRNQNVRPKLCQMPHSITSSRKLSRMISSRLSQDGHAPHRRTQAMRRFGENSLPHMLHCASVQIGNRTPDTSVCKGQSALRRC